MNPKSLSQHEWKTQIICDFLIRHIVPNSINDNVHLFIHCGAGFSNSAIGLVWREWINDPHTWMRKQTNDYRAAMVNESCNTTLFSGTSQCIINSTTSINHATLSLSRFSATFLKKVIASTWLGHHVISVLARVNFIDAMAFHKHATFCEFHQIYQSFDIE